MKRILEVGDIIRVTSVNNSYYRYDVEITVLENGKNKFHIASVYVNYVTLYKNGEKLNVLPQSVFGDVMAKNFKLKQLTD